MKIEFDRKFSKDFLSLPEYMQKAISDLNKAFEKASSINEISQCKKMKGSKNLYRIRHGDYRVTLCLIDHETIEFRRVLTRGQIYKKHVK